VLPGNREKNLKQLVSD
jgi:hypothetical protein